MSIVRARLLPVLAIAACLALPAPAAAAGPSKEFKVHNLKWTLPDDWSFKEVSAQDKANGHLIAAVSPGNDVYAAVFCSGSDLPPVDRAYELEKQLVPHILGGGVEGVKILDTTLSGVDAKVVVAEGKHGSGAPGHVRLYVMGHRGKIYHLEIRTYNGAHMERRDEINALRTGFRLIKGAKGKDEYEKFDEFPPEDDEDGDDDSSSPGNGSSSNWPEKGPKREGDKLIFTGMNLEWSIEGTPLRWRNPIKDLKDAYEIANKGATVRHRTVVECIGSIERRKQEFEKDTPDHNIAIGFFKAFRLPFGMDSSERLASSALQKGLQRDYNLGEIQASKTRTMSELPIGNIGRKGYMLQMTADHKGLGEEVTLLHIEVQLKGMMYMWDFLLRGHTDRFKAWRGPLSTMLAKKIHFPDPKDNIAGPALPPEGVTPFAGIRGKEVTKKKRTRRAPGGITFVVPVGMYELDDLAKRRGNKDLQFAVEWRSDDGDAYIYFDVHTWPAAAMRKGGKKLDVMADERKGAWLAGGGEEADVGKIKKGGSLFKFRGDWKYEFRAKIGDTPFIEEGVWAKQKTYFVWARVQYGGENVKKHKQAKKLLSQIKKGIKLK